jgi:hypothetical protein
MTVRRAAKTALGLTSRGCAQGRHITPTPGFLHLGDFRSSLLLVDNGMILIYNSGNIGRGRIGAKRWQRDQSGMSTYELNEPSVVAETIDDEAIVINLDRGIYFSIRGTGLAIWSDLIAGVDPHRIAGRLATRTQIAETDAVQDVTAFVRELASEGLIRSRTGELVAVPAFSLDGLQYAKPALEKHTDMEALLLLDPIHDVDAAGWPRRHKS